MLSLRTNNQVCHLITEQVMETGAQDAGVTAMTGIVLFHPCWRGLAVILR